MGSAGNHTDVVNRQGRIDLFHLLLQPEAEFTQFAVGIADGVVVNYNGKPLLFEILFDLVNQLMTLQSVDICGNFHMNAGELSAGSVIVHHQVVGTENPLIGQHLLFNAIDKGLIGGPPQQMKRATAAPI